MKLQYKGTISYFWRKMNLFGVSLFLLTLFVLSDKFYKPINDIYTITVEIIFVILSIDLALNEKFSNFKITKTEVTYTKTLLFGLIKFKRVFDMQQELIEILNFYKDEPYFSIDCFNDLAGAKVVFKNKLKGGD